MVRLEGFPFHLECPVCAGEVPYREELRVAGFRKVYHVTCPDCSALLAVCSCQYTNFLAMAPAAALTYCTLHFLFMGARAEAASFVSAFALLAALVFNALLRDYTVFASKSPEWEPPVFPPTDPGSGLAWELLSLWKILTAKNGWPSSLGRCLFVAGAALAVVSFSGTHYIGIWSLAGWLLQWAGLALILRGYSLIISFGGGFLLATLLLLAEDGGASILRLILHH